MLLNKYTKLVFIVLFGMVSLLQAKELSAEAKKYGYEGHVLLQKGQFNQAKVKLEKAQSLGDVKAMHSLGLMYKNGESVKKSVKTAQKYYIIAAKNNYMLAQIELAKIYAYQGNKKQFDYWAKKVQSHRGAR